MRRYRVLRPIDEPNYVLVDLEFDNPNDAEAMRVALTEMWRRVAAEGLIGSQRAQIVETVESRDY